MTTIVWFQRDLRINDNPVLTYATELNHPILPVFIFAPEDDYPWEIGAASRWWLHHSLIGLSHSLKDLGLHLSIWKGPTAQVLEKLIKKSKATHLLWNRQTDGLKREKKIEVLAKRHHCQTQSFSSALLFEPGEVLTQQGKPYTVFTPFWRSCLKAEIPGLSGKIKDKLKQAKIGSKGLEVDDLKLLPKIHWDKSFYLYWQPGEEGAWKRLNLFKRKKLDYYSRGRDFPAADMTSCLSPHLHFGEITSRQIWHELEGKKGVASFLRELGWREFAHHLLYFFPKTPLHPLKREFSDFPWKKNRKWVHLWQRGQTGVPIVDAGMRQLWRIGWMHNRIRMIVASYLVKDLMIPWQEGARWFWDTLVDADLANNTLGWQWVAGCGADAAVYFRIFNPYLQGERFDPQGDYIRTFVPELAKLPKKWIHQPHLAPESILRSAGVVLGKTYPFPIIDHTEARKQALKLYTQWVKR